MLTSSRLRLLFKVEMCYSNDGQPDHSLKPQHVAFLDKSETHEEHEFLFSAYSAFRVHSVKRSKHPKSSAEPHEITLVACVDNKIVEENAPTAPWA